MNKKKNKVDPTYQALSNVLVERNKNKNFVDRFVNPSQYPVINNPDGSYSTHLMGYETDNQGGAYVYPQIVQQGNSLTNLQNNAGEYAFENNEFIYSPSSKLADYFSEIGYKNYSKYENGGKMKVKVKSAPKANNGLAIEGNQFDYLSPKMIEIKGKSHNKGGTDLSYNGQTIEAESGEPLMIDGEGNAVIFGNLEIPGTKKKFKTAAKQLGREEAKALKQQDNAFKLIDESNPFNQYSSLSFNAGKVMEDGASQKQIAIEEKKQELADTQQFMLDLANNTGKSPEKISSIFRDGGKLKQYKDGGSVAERHNNPGNVKFAKWMEKYGAVKGQAGTDGGNFAKFPSLEQGQQAMAELLTRPIYANKSVDQAVTTWTGGAPYRHIPDNIRNKKVSSLAPGEFRALLDTITTGEDSKSYNWDNISGPRPKDDMRGSQGQPIKMDEVVIADRRQEAPVGYMPFSSELRQQNSPISPAAPQKINTFANPQAQSPSTSPRRMTSAADMNKLRPTDFLSEIPAIFDRADYVQGQSYEPILYQPFQMSFQDRLNQNNSSFRAINQQLPNNPEALSVLAAQKYNADNQVLGEQFRVNQQISNDVTNKNVGILNDATLKNLQLQDQQYMRQEQAKAVTNTRRDQAIASISNKFGQNRKDNNTIRLYENMFNYRPDEQLKMQYQGPDAVFSATPRIDPLYDSNMSASELSAIAKYKAIQEKRTEAAQKSSKRWGGFLNKKK